MKEEVFGPVVVINMFKTEEETVAEANNTEFGLYAVLYTNVLNRALRLGKKLESEMVGINCANPTGSWDLLLEVGSKVALGRRVCWGVWKISWSIRAYISRFLVLEVEI